MTGDRLFPRRFGLQTAATHRQRITLKPPASLEFSALHSRASPGCAEGRRRRARYLALDRVETPVPLDFAPVSQQARTGGRNAYKRCGHPLNSCGLNRWANRGQTEMTGPSPSISRRCSSGARQFAAIRHCHWWAWMSTSQSRTKGTTFNFNSNDQRRRKGSRFAASGGERVDA